MRRGGALGSYGHFVRVAAAVAAALALANCSSGTVDRKYGVSASTRVVEPGQPVPKGGGVYRVGKPYTIAGKTYVPEEDANYRAEGMASWYGEDFHGRYTANGEVFDMNSVSAAHPTLPLPSYVRVTNLKNRRSLVVRVNDRGPYAHDRLIDLSVQSAKLLGFYGHGLAPVRVEYVGRAPLAGSDDRKLMATLRIDGRMMAGQEPEKAKIERPVQVASNATPNTATSRSYSREYFDARPMTQMSSAARPAVEARPLDTLRAAPARVAAAEPVPMAKPEPARLTSPVSAYAPVGYDSRAGIMSGRGLY